MRHVAAYILAVIGGNANPSEADLKKILNSVGVDIVDEQLAVVIDQLNGKDLFQLMEEGQSLLAGMPMGGGAGASSGAAVAEAVEVVEAPKEEVKKAESSDSEDSDMGMGLFD
jgi:large subunit ribosomal protein LP2